MNSYKSNTPTSRMHFVTLGCVDVNIMERGEYNEYVLGRHGGLQGHLMMDTRKQIMTRFSRGAQIITSCTTLITVAWHPSSYICLYIQFLHHVFICVCVCVCVCVYQWWGPRFTRCAKHHSYMCVFRGGRQGRRVINEWSIGRGGGRNNERTFLWQIDTQERFHT